MIDVALRRSEARAAEVAVVIDVLRASTTITCAVAAGYRRVIVADGIERALALGGPGRVLAGEVECVRPPGFDLGNSPGEVSPAQGEELVLATTNGAPAIVAAAQCSDEVMIACLRNLDAVVRAIGRRSVVVVCAGVADRVGVDDVYVAGRITARLEGSRTDAALTAEAVAAGFATANDAIGSGAAARLLREAGLEQDVAFCAEESVLDLVPRVTGRATDGVIIERTHDDRDKISLAVLEYVEVP